MLDTLWGWLRDRAEAGGLGVEVLLVLLMLVVGWKLGGPWVFAAILASMVLLARGLA